MNVKSIVLFLCAAVLVLGLLFGVFGGVGSNDDQNWQVVQSLGGNIEIRDEPGWYAKLFATVWTWPRADQVFIGTIDNDEVEQNFQSVRVTFNDGGTADCNVMLRFQYPTTEQERRLLHREFSGNPENVKQSIYQHVVNVIKATGPMMSSSEHQSARKGEFTQLVFDQAQAGIYEMRRIEKEINLGVEIDAEPLVDPEGKPINNSDAVVQDKKIQRVLANEIIVNSDGSPRIGQESPLSRYGIVITQLSITDVDYDEMTRQQFAAKKEAFLRAERAKAERQEEVEQTLMVVQRGLRERAEVESIANKEKASAVIAAQREAEVAEELKRKEETEAAKRLAVAQKEKEIAQTQAQQRLEVEKLNAQAAEQQALATRTLAAAEEEKIAKAGAVTERERVLAEIEANAKVKIAEHLAKIGVPSTVIVGGSGENGGASMQDTLMNLTLLKATGILDTSAKGVEDGEHRQRLRQNANGQ